MLVKGSLRSKRAASARNKLVDGRKKVKKAKLMYKCMHKQEVMRNFLMEKMNEHGAMDNVHELKPVFEIQFMYNPFIKIGEIPEVLSVVHTYTTTNVEVAGRYQVGEEYSELPR